jgi:hypothetical protein
MARADGISGSDGRLAATPPLQLDREVAVRRVPPERARGYDPLAVHLIAPNYRGGRRYWPHDHEWDF